SHLVRLEPDSAVPLGYRGEARLRSGDRAGAKEDFRRAVTLEPDYVFGLMQLFDMHLADAEHDAAETTLQQLKAHAGDEFTCAREAQLSAARGDRPRALDCLRRLCTWKTDATWPLDTTIAALLKAEWAEAVEE